MCRKPKSTSTTTARSNVNSIADNTTKNCVNAVLHKNYYPECNSDYDSSDDNMVAGTESNTLNIGPKNTIRQIEIQKWVISLTLEEVSAVS